MNIIPDFTLALIQVVPFLVLVAGLNVIIFKPMLAYLHDRNVATVGAKHDAEALAKRAEARMGEYEAALAHVRSELTEYRTGLRQSAHKVHAAQVAAAKKASDGRLQLALADVAQSARAARASVGPMSKEIAVDIATRVLGRPVEA